MVFNTQTGKSLASETNIKIIDIPQIRKIQKFNQQIVGNRNENSILMTNMPFLVSIKPEIHTEENCVS